MLAPNNIWLHTAIKKENACDDCIPKIAIGAAGFGTPYGNFNQSIGWTQNDVGCLLDAALNFGVKTIDTASGYENSEAIIGGYPKRNSFNIVSKISFDLTVDDGERFSVVKQSLYKLKIAELDALLIHNAERVDRTHWTSMFRFLEELKETKMAKKVGISVYSPALAIAIMKEYPIDLVQIPFNIFDQRPLSCDFFEICQAKNVEVHARSVFLQGFGLATLDSLPKYFSKHAIALKKLQIFCDLQFDIAANCLLSLCFKTKGPWQNHLRHRLLITVRTNR